MFWPSSFHITKYLAYLGARVILAARNQTKTEKVINDIIKLIPNAKLEFKYLDLTDSNSVNDFIKYFIFRFFFKFGYI